MVNTFLVSADVRISAAQLDWTRLGKQRVEAMQLLHGLINFDYLSWYFNVLAPPAGCSKDELYNWIDELVDKYKQLDLCFVWQEGSTEPKEVPRLTGGKKYLKKRENEVYQVKGERVHLATKTGKNPRTVPVSEFLFPGEYLMDDALRKHPALLLWHGYTNALAHYTNIHIEEWIKRGYSNNMVLYDVDDTVEYPPWVASPEIHRRMKARLREKELEGQREHQRYLDRIAREDNGEDTSDLYRTLRSGRQQLILKERARPVPVHYTTFDDFMAAGPDDGYIWEWSRELGIQV